MAFGVSITDIEKTFKVAFWIYERAFSKAQGAHIQYFNFGQDIKGLAETLQRLPQIIQNADDQGPPRPSLKPEDDYRAAPVAEAAGDFTATLGECQLFLENNRRFQTDTKNFVKNVQWSLGVERNVSILRERVRFHLIKLGILLKPFELQLLSDIRRELHFLRETVIEIKGLLIARDGFTSAAPAQIASGTSTGSSSSMQIPDTVARRFTNALESYPPASYTDPSNLPLRAATDALIYHFSRSTTEYNPGLDLNQRMPKVPQYLNLLKSSWILAKLGESSELTSQPPHSLWIKYLDEIRNEISKESARFEPPEPKLDAPSEDVILLLDDSCYSIWVPDPPSIGPAPLAEQGFAEEKILELELPDSSATRQNSLTVHRRSLVEFRLVTTMMDKHNKDFRHEKEIVVNTDASAIVPAYALPSQNAADPSSILISSHHVRDLNWRILKTLEDAHLLQQALLGYRVFHDMSDVWWSINGSNKRHGRMQLWQHQTLKDLSQGENGVALSPVMSTGLESQPLSPVREAGLAQSQRRISTLSGSSILSGPTLTSRVTGPRGYATVLVPPNPPVMVLFMMHEEKHTFLHLEITCDIIIDIEKCDCRNDKKPCSATIVRNAKKKNLKRQNLKLRRHSAQGPDDQGLTTWDLAIFRHPQHPQFKNLEILASVKYLRLDFSSTTENRRFQIELKELQKVRDLDLRAYNKALDERHNRASAIG